MLATIQSVLLQVILIQIHMCILNAKKLMKNLSKKLKTL